MYHGQNPPYQRDSVFQYRPNYFKKRASRPLANDTPVSSLAKKFIVRRGVRGEREGPDVLPEGARSPPSFVGVRGEREGPDVLPEGARSPRYLKSALAPTRASMSAITLL